MRIAVFVSGRGSNMKALLDENPGADFFVFSNKQKEPQAFGWAKKRGVSTQLVSLKTEQDWSAFAAHLNKLKIKNILLLGFMKIVPSSFLEKINADCLNLHPSVLPSFPGLKSIEKTFTEKKAMGCTVHKVSGKVDAGEVYLQKRLSFPSAKFEKFEEQVHQAEQDTVFKHCSLKLLKVKAS